MAQRLGRVDHQRKVEASAQVGQRCHRLRDTTVTRQRGQVYQRRPVGGQRAGSGVDVEPAVTVDGQCAHVETVGGHDRQVRPVLSDQAGDGALTRPTGQQDVERIVGAGGVHDIAAAQPGERADGRTARVEHRGGGLGGDVSADFGFVAGMLGRGVDDGEALP